MPSLTPPPSGGDGALLPSFDVSVSDMKDKVLAIFGSGSDADDMDVEDASAAASVDVSELREAFQSLSAAYESSSDQGAVGAARRPVPFVWI